MCTETPYCVRVLLGFVSLGFFVLFISCWSMGFPHSSVGKESTCNAGDLGSIPGLRRFPGGEHGKKTPVLLPEESHGQRRLVGYSP